MRKAQALLEKKFRICKTRPSDKILKNIHAKRTSKVNIPKSARETISLKAEKHIKI